MEEYREYNDWLGQFPDDCCEVASALKEKSGELYQSYRGAYCMQSGEYIRSTTDFYSAIDKEGFIRRKTNRGMIVYGLKLKKEQDFFL